MLSIVDYFTPFHWAIAALAAIIVGFAKTGVPGTGILSVPLIAMIIPGQTSVGALLPMLCFADIFAVAYYRKHVEWTRFLQLLPWAAAGVVIGFALLTFDILREAAVMNRFIGVTIIVMLLLNIIRKRCPDLDAKVPRNWVFAAVFGLLAGILTMMANGAGPLMAIYLLAMNFDKRTFMGTRAVYFFTLNLFKVPFHVTLGNITVPTLQFNAVMIPALVGGALLGRYIFTRLRQEWFVYSVEVLTLAAAIKLIVG